MPDLPISPSITGSGSATAPNGAVFCSTSSVPKAGRYRVRGIYILTGTQETTAMNMRLIANGLAKLDMPTGQLTGSYPITFELTLDLDGVNNVSLRSVGASTGGSVYSGSVICDRLT